MREEGQTWGKRERVDERERERERDWGGKVSEREGK